MFFLLYQSYIVHNINKFLFSVDLCLLQFRNVAAVFFPLKSLVKHTLAHFIDSLKINDKKKLRKYFDSDNVTLFYIYRMFNSKQVSSKIDSRDRLNWNLDEIMTKIDCFSVFAVKTLELYKFECDKRLQLNVFFWFEINVERTS